MPGHYLFLFNFQGLRLLIVLGVDLVRKISCDGTEGYVIKKEA